MVSKDEPFTDFRAKAKARMGSGIIGTKATQLIVDEVENGDDPHGLNYKVTKDSEPDLIVFDEIIDNMDEFWRTQAMSIKKKTNSNLDEATLECALDSMANVLNHMMPGWEEDPSTVGTARRFIEYMAEYTQEIPFDRIFKSMFKQKDDASHSIVAQVDIPFRGMCEHHLLPMWGKAHLGYIPSGHVIGLSKMVRLVQAVGVERPSLQEHYADRIMSLMKEHVKPMGTALVIQSEHSCMACRGVNAPGVPTVTSMMDGVFSINPHAKQEFIDLIKIGKMK